MLVYPDGTQAGTLGGGCVEAEVERSALHRPRNAAGRPEVLTFCLDDDYGWDDGLICGGRMTILADPGCDLSNAAAVLPAAARTCSTRATGCTEAVVVGNAPACRRRPLPLRRRRQSAASTVAGAAPRGVGRATCRS